MGGAKAQSGGLFESEVNSRKREREIEYVDVTDLRSEEWFVE